MTIELQAGQFGAVDPYAETVRVRILPEMLPETDLQPPAGSEAPAQGLDPYNSDIGATDRRPRKTLDDMRRLSEAIKRNRSGSK
jgi:hypothetical protein